MLSGALSVHHILRIFLSRLIFLCLFLCLITLPAIAETKIITAEGDYTMGEGETMLVAKERAVNIAMRNAVEQAGVYLESLSQIQNLQLTKDEVTVIAAGTVEVLDKKFDDPKFQSGGAYFRVTITARVNTDNIESLRNKLREKSVAAEYKKAQTDYARLQAEVEELKRQLTAAKTEQARKQAETLIVRNEQVFSAVQWFEKGYRYHIQQDYDQAITAYTKAISFNPQYAVAYNNRGLVYSDTAQHDQAIADLNQAISLEPQSIEFYNNRGNAYCKKGQYDQAIADYNQAVNIDPRHAGSYFNRGLVYSDIGQYDLAIADFEQAIALDPRDSKPFNSRGLIYNYKGMYDLAISDFNQAIALDPKDSVAYNRRGVIQVKEASTT